MALSIVPQLWNKYVLEAMIAQNNVLNGGMVEIDPNPIFSDGDTRFRIPKVQSADNWDDDTQYTKTSTLVPTELTDYEELIPILHRERGLKITDYEKVLRGQNLLDTVVPQIAAYNLRQIQKKLASVLIGLFTTSGVLVATHQLDKTVGTISFAYINEAALKLGENMMDLTAMYVNSKVYNDMLTEGILTFKEAGAFAEKVLKQGTIPYFMGRRVVVNDVICAAKGTGSDEYPTYLVGGMPFYVGYQKNLRFETYRQALVGGGTDNLIWRVDYGVGVKGVSYTDGTSSAGADVDTTHLELAGNWTKKASQAGHIKVVELLTK